MTRSDSTAPAPFGHYSPAVVSPNGTIWVSAQLPVGGASPTFGEVFGEHRPARAVLQIAGLHHGFRVAADAVAWTTGRDGE